MENEHSLQKIEKESNHHQRIAFSHRIEVIEENLQVDIQLVVLSQITLSDISVKTNSVIHMLL